MGKRQLLLFGLILFTAGGLGWRYREAIKAAWRDWFWAPMHPMTLAIFRAVVFIELLVTANPRVTLFYAGLPKELQYPPLIANWVDWNPSLGLAQLVLALFQVACLCGLLGFFTRTSALIAVVTGTYVLGIPQLFGKVNHCHHLIWFALLLACGPPALALSLDGMYQSWKRADRGEVDGPKPHVAHGLPLKIAVCLMGLMYVFPGIWKVLNGGPDWVLPRNVANLMHQDWLLMGHWLPPIRIEAPLLLFAGAVGTVLFELGFFPLALFARTRPFAFVGGLIFHNITYLNLGIRFGTLQAMYVALIDWFLLFKNLGRRIWKSPLYVVYDGDCRFCRRVLASIKSLELFDQLVLIDGQAVDQLPDGTPIPYTREERLKDVFAFTGQWHRGEKVYVQIIKRVPLLWVLLPIFAIPGVARDHYRRTADSRHLLIGNQKTPPPRELGAKPLLAVGAFLFLSLFVLGVMDEHRAWPLASYPTYEAVAGPTVKHLAFQSEGKMEVPQFDPEARKLFMANRLNGVLTSIRNDRDPAHQLEALRSFWHIWKPDSALPDAVLEVESQTDPAKWNEVPKIVRALPFPPPEQNATK